MTKPTELDPAEVADYVLSFLFKRGKPMGDARITLGIVACLTTFAGCATTVGQVQEVGTGTYSISYGRSYGTTDTAMKDSVGKAGEYCHSKGQKLLVMPNPARENNVTFRCVSSDEVAPANTVNEQRAH
jgi:hypothetical protein